jgi:uracil-DNA glycosylase
VMGEGALAVLNELELPLAAPIEPREGEIQRLTSTIDALYVPDIDDSLDTDDSKQRFWSALRVLGEWYDRLPPY